MTVPSKDCAIAEISGMAVSRRVPTPRSVRRQHARRFAGWRLNPCRRYLTGTSHEPTTAHHQFHTECASHADASRCAAWERVYLRPFL